MGPLNDENKFKADVKNNKKIQKNYTNSKERKNKSNKFEKEQYHKL